MSAVGGRLAKIKGSGLAWWPGCRLSCRSTRMHPRGIPGAWRETRLVGGQEGYYVQWEPTAAVVQARNDGADPDPCDASLPLLRNRLQGDSVRVVGVAGGTAGFTPGVTMWISLGLSPCLDLFRETAFPRMCLLMRPTKGGES